MNIKELKKLILNRASCRNFTEQKVEKEKIKAVVEAARYAPSACNSQPWAVHAVINDNKRKKVARAVQSLGMNKFASKVPVFFVVTQKREKFLPKTADIFKRVDYAAIDIGIFVAHIVLAATAIGLSSCIIGWFNAKAIRKIINTKNKIRLIIALGYGNKPITDKKRKNIADILKFYD